MKPLKPSHRENKRYLLIKGKDADKKNIDESILEFIGVLGYGEAMPKIIKSENQTFRKSLTKSETKKVVLAINRNSLDKIRTSFLMSGKNLEIVKVSGSVGKVK